PHQLSSHFPYTTLFRSAETGMRAELLAGGTLGIEAVENRFEFAIWYARALIGHCRAHGPAFTPQAHPDDPARRAERNRIGDQVSDRKSTRLNSSHDQIS